MSSDTECSDAQHDPHSQVADMKMEETVDETFEAKKEEVPANPASPDAPPDAGEDDEDAGEDDEFIQRCRLAYERDSEQPKAEPLEPNAQLVEQVHQALCSALLLQAIAERRSTVSGGEGAHGEQPSSSSRRLPSPPGHPQGWQRPPEPAGPPPGAQRPPEPKEPPRKQRSERPGYDKTEWENPEFQGYWKSRRSYEAEVYGVRRGQSASAKAKSQEWLAKKKQRQWK